MNIYVDNGGTVKIYPVRPEVAKAVMTLLEADGELVWSETHSGYGVTIKDLEQEPVLDKIRAEVKQLQYQHIVSNFSLLEAVVEIIDKYKAESEE